MASWHAPSEEGCTRWRCGSDNTYIHMIESTQRTAVSPTASALAVALYSVYTARTVTCAHTCSSRTTDYGDRRLVRIFILICDCQCVCEKNYNPPRFIFSFLGQTRMRICAEILDLHTDELDNNRLGNMCAHVLSVLSLSLFSMQRNFVCGSECRFTSCGRAASTAPEDDVFLLSPRSTSRVAAAHRSSLHASGVLT